AALRVALNGQDFSPHAAHFDVLPAPRVAALRPAAGPAPPPAPPPCRPATTSATARRCSAARSCT
ncbi:MAG: hypothetical protein ACK4FW_07890, partial [Stenotrophomonas sp.]